MTDYDGKDFVEDSQNYIEGRLETGSQQPLDDYNRRADELEREIGRLEREIESQGASEDRKARLSRMRGDLDGLRSRGNSQ